MKRYLFLLTAIFLFLPLALLACAFGLPEQYGETFMGELKYKAERLETAAGRRIVVVGGSGAAFGMDSALLMEEMPEYRAVNFGMYAALGTKAMLELSLPRLREGDIVIVSPEQNRQTLSDYFNAEMMWQGADGAFRLLAALDSSDWGRLAGQLPYFAAAKLRYAVTGRPEAEGVYCRAAFDSLGDLRPELREHNVMAGLYDPSTPVRFTEDAAAEGFLDMLNAYAAAAARRGAAVYYRFCPVNALAVTAGDPDSFYDFLAEHLTFPILGDPNDSVMDPLWFYDTNFHLNAAGAVFNTRNLVRCLKAELGDSSPTGISIPVPPAAAAEARTQGDDSMEQCFLYGEYADGWKITGTVEDCPTRLVAPTLHDGRPVYALEALACGAEELVLQENITVIYNGAFSDCPALRRIELLNETPSGCRVGGGLLEGTEADLYVPPAALEAYRLSYFWSPYADRLHPGGQGQTDR